MKKLTWLLVILLWNGLTRSAVAEEALFRRVHELELAGNNVERRSELEKLQNQAGNDPRTHWLRGEIQVDGEWLPHRRVVDQGDRWAELHRYREQRSKRTHSKEDQYFLADGCRQHQLFDEERAHLFGVLMADPTDAEAHHRLGDLLVDGIWIRAEEARRTKQVATANLKAFESWRKVIGDQKKLLASSSSKRHTAAIQALMKIQVPEAIPVIEAAFASGNEQEQLLFKTWVCRLSSWKASASLARLAISTDSARVRLETIKELKRRPLEEFAPTILSAMATPIQIRIETQKYGMWTLYNQVAQYETQNQEHRFHYTARYAPEFLFQTPGLDPTEPRNNIDRIINSQPAGERIMLNLANQQEKLAGQQNALATIINDRCSRILTEVTGCAGLQKPQEWWAWWEDDQGYIMENKEQIFGQYHEEWYVDRRRQPRRENKLTANRFVKQGSCFAAATPVMTEFGSKPIESIRVGDRVLSQDVESGELAFKPVLRTPTRSSPGSVIVSLAEEQIHCTPCHPFWVNGKGWTMARDLESADRFHSLDGAVSLTSVVAADHVEVYNLEVADFNTYFVGQSQVLTHDVTIRRPSDQALPGFAKPTIQSPVP